MVDLIEDDERPSRLGLVAVQRKLVGHLCIRHGHTDELGSVATVAVLEVGVDGQAYACCGVRPLTLQVLRRGHHVEPKLTSPDSKSSLATLSAKVVLLTPGVATARKSLGLRRT